MTHDVEQDIWTVRSGLLANDTPAHEALDRLIAMLIESNGDTLIAGVRKGDLYGAVER